MKEKFSTSDGYMRRVKKMKDGYAEIDEKKKIITIDKSKTKGKPLYGFSKKENTIINSMVHEEMHREHPKMTEKQVRKETAKKVESMTDKQKQKVRSKYP